MCDVFLKVGGKEFSAHRLILCATSDVFQVCIVVIVLISNNWCYHRQCL